MFLGHFSSAEIWRGSTINRRDHSGEEGLGEEEVCSEHLLVSKSRALMGLFRWLFPTPTVPHPQLFLQPIKTRIKAKCPNLGHHVPALACHHPKSTKAVPGRKGVCPTLDLSSTQVNSMDLPWHYPLSSLWCLTSIRLCLTLVQNSEMSSKHLRIKPTHRLWAIPLTR